MDGYWHLFWETGAPEFYLLREEAASPEDPGAQTPAGG